jgi:hypothetical protein
VQPDSLEQLYRAKTDDELLALGADRGSLVPEAQALLAQELARRGLAVQRPTIRVESDTVLHLEENPAFNAPAKVGVILLALFVFGTVAFFFVAIVTRDLGWKRELSMVAVVMLLFWGPIFAAIAWATRRNLRKARLLPKNRKL